MQIPDNDMIEAVKDVAKAVEDGKDSIKWVIISIFAGIARTVVSEDKRNIGAFMFGSITAGFVGYMAHIGLNDTDLSQASISVITGVAAFSATDILRGIMKISKAFADDPHKAVRDIFSTWKARK